MESEKLTLINNPDQQQFEALIAAALRQVADPPAMQQMVTAALKTPTVASQLSVEEENELIVASQGELGPFFAAVHLGQLLLRSQPVKYGTAYSSSSLGKAMVKRLAGKTREEVVIACTNVHNEIIDLVTLFQGGQAECHVYPEEILRYALKAGAHGVVMVHNHPTGDPTPSACDLKLMKRLETACTIVGFQLLDCLVIGNRDYYSWRETQKGSQVAG